MLSGFLESNDWIFLKEWFRRSSSRVQGPFSLWPYNKPIKINFQCEFLNNLSNKDFHFKKDLSIREMKSFVVRAGKRILCSGLNYWHPLWSETLLFLDQLSCHIWELNFPIYFSENIYGREAIAIRLPGWINPKISWCQNCMIQQRRLQLQKKVPNKV